MKLIDEKDKNLKWYNRNFFYVTTVSLIVFITICHFCLKDFFASVVSEAPLWNVILMSFQHKNPYHLIGNMITFAIVSSFLERHFGSFTYLFVFLFSVVLGNIAVFCFSGTYNWVGESGTNFFLFAIFFLTVIFNCRRYLTKNKWCGFTWGLLLLVCIVMCWNGTSNITSFGDFWRFGFFSDLVNVSAHWAGFLMGVLVYLFVYLISFSNKHLTLTQKP